MPAGPAGNQRDLDFGFLDLVFTKHVDAGRKGGIHALGRDGLGHREQRNLPAARADAVLKTVDSGGQFGHRDSLRSTVAHSQAITIMRRCQSDRNWGTSTCWRRSAKAAWARCSALLIRRSTAKW